MNTANDVRFDDSAVYQRTLKGQRELLDASGALTRMERKFLGMITGFTPVSALLGLGLDATDLCFAASRLVELELVRLVPAQRSRGST